jgi:hypothetical protein
VLSEAGLVSFVIVALDELFRGWGMGKRSAIVPHHRRQKYHPPPNDEPWDSHHATPWVEG